MNPPRTHKYGYCATVNGTNYCLNQIIVARICRHAHKDVKNYISTWARRNKLATI